MAYHRLVFRHHCKERLVRWSNRTAIAGLALVAAAVSAAVALVVSFVAAGLIVMLTATVVPAAFAGLWFVLPLASRRDP